MRQNKPQHLFFCVPFLDVFCEQKKLGTAAPPRTNTFRDYGGTSFTLGLQRHDTSFVWGNCVCEEVCVKL